LTKLEWVQQHSYAGQLLQRALRKLSAIRLGITITLDDVLTDEMYAMALIEDEREKFEKESNGK